VHFNNASYYLQIQISSHPIDSKSGKVKSNRINIHVLKRKVLHVSHGNRKIMHSDPALTFTRRKQERRLYVEMRLITSHVFIIRTTTGSLVILLFYFVDDSSFSINNRAQNEICGFSLNCKVAVGLWMLKAMR